jgi:hypothetical protein
MMTYKKKVENHDTIDLANCWGKVVCEYYDEDGKIVRIFENGCSIIGEPNPEARQEVTRNILRFLVENPSILENEQMSRGEGIIQIHFRS